MTDADYAAEALGCLEAVIEACEIFDDANTAKPLDQQEKWCASPATFGRTPVH